MQYITAHGGRANCRQKGDSLENIKKAIDLAMQKFKEEFGEDTKLEDGNEFVTIFNNCVLIISLENGHLKIKFIEGKPYEVDMEVNIFESGD